MNLGAALPLVAKPSLKWEGIDEIGSKCRIEGSPETGFQIQYFDEELGKWVEPTAALDYRFLLIGFVTDLMKRAEEAKVA